MTARLRVLAWPLVAVLVVVAAALLPAPDRGASTGAERLAVQQRTLVCAGGSLVAAGSGAARAGAEREARVLPEGDPVEDLSGPATDWATARVDDPVSVTTRDEAGAGPVAFTRADAGGLELGACPWPGAASSPFLVGGGAGDGHQSTLVLTADPAAGAVVDLRLWGTEGPVEGVGTDGVALEPGESRSLRLEDLAAGEPELAVQVVVRTGQVAAVLRDRVGGTSGGRELVAPVERARRSQVVAGAVPGDERRLVLLNPGSTSAPVRVEALGPDGRFAPTGLDDLEAPAGAVTSVRLPAALGDDVVALRVRADVPLVATVRTATGRDVADAAPGPVLDGPAVAPVALGDLDEARVALSAPRGAATVRLVARDASGREVGTRSVDVPAGTTVVADLTGLGRGTAWVEVRPDGDVHAAATYRAGRGTATLPLRAAPVDVRAPRVVPAR